MAPESLSTSSSGSIATRPTLPGRAPAGPRWRSGCPAKDPAELAVANDPAAVAATPADGCTSVASRGAGAWWWGHTEDSSPEAIGGIYLVDAQVDTSPVAPGGRSKPSTTPRPSPAAPPVNEAGLIVLIDALPDPDRRVGAPRHMVSRAVLDLPRSTLASTTCSRRSARGAGTTSWYRGSGSWTWRPRRRACWCTRPVPPGPTPTPTTTSTRSSPPTPATPAPTPSPVSRGPWSW